MTLAFTCEVEVAPGLVLGGYMFPSDPNRRYVQPVSLGNRRHHDDYWGTWYLEENKVEPFFKAEVIGKGETRQVTRQKAHGWGHRSGELETVTDTYDDHGHTTYGDYTTRHHSYNHHYPQSPWIYLKVRVTHIASGHDQIIEVRVPGPDTGVVDVSAYTGTDSIEIKGDFFGFAQQRAYQCKEYRDFVHLSASPAYTRVQTMPELWAWWLEASGAPATLDETDTEAQLREEMHLRENRRLMGLCDYCNRRRDETPCKFPERHAVESQTTFATPSTCRLARWLRTHPDVFTAVVKALKTPVATCEGHQGPCEGKVLWPTPSMTAYEWDGKGEDPNAPRNLCPPCSQAHVETMQDQWDEYNAGRL